MKRILFIVFSLFISFAISSQSIYKVDPAHSSVNFRVKHLGITFVSGKFEKFDGGIIGSLNNVTQSRVFFNVNIESINTSVEMRDDHLRSPDFFDAEKFPTMTFESTSIEKSGENEYKLKGKLQIKDVTKDVAFDVKYGGVAKGLDGGEVIGFVAEKTLNRLDYNISSDPEGLTIGKDVDIKLYLEFKKSE